MSGFRSWRRDATRRCAASLHSLFPSRCSDEELLEELVPRFNWQGTRPRVLYVGLQNDYGRPSRGLSYEELNFFHTLEAAGYPVAKFASDVVWGRVGRERMQRLLWLACIFYRPDVLFHVAFKDELEGDVLRRIADELGIPTVAWFCDDHWRFDDYSRHAAPAYAWVCTTCGEALPRYEAAGIKQVIKTQWAANHFLYRPSRGAMRCDVSFVGQPHGNRKEILRRLEAQDIAVEIWGQGWGKGRASFDRMIDIFSRSRINLNLSKSSGAHESLQIKGRDFEVPACGGFLLTQRNPELEEYFQAEGELATYGDQNELVEKIRYYLAHEAERERVRQGAYRRVLADHTFERRFEEIFGVVLGRKGA